MNAAFEQTLARLRDQGAVIHAVNIADALTQLNVATDTVIAYEAAEFHRERYEQYGSQLAHLGDLIRKGLDTSPAQYGEARRFIDAQKEAFNELFAVTPIILTPAATGPAPHGLASTGDPRMNAPWTALGTPAISIPMPVSGLPLGLQLTADRGQDGRLLRAAVRIEEMLRR